jgi:hypothetical protein
MITQEQLTLSGFAERAIIDRAWASTFRVMDLTDQREGGTCVAIRLDSHYFMATAAHVIRDGHTLAIVSKGTVESYIEHFLAAHRDDGTDVAVIELRPEVANRFDRYFVDASSQLCVVPSNADVFVWIIGCPGQYLFPTPLIQVSRNVFLRDIGCAAVTVPSSTIPQCDWPKHPVHPRLQPMVDLLLSNQATGPLQFFEPCNAGGSPPTIDAAPPSLNGVSGGGVWTHAQRLGKRLWRAMPQLIGIQRGLLPNSGIVRATSIRAWLELVEAHYPDTRDTIARIRKRRPSRHTSVPQPREGVGTL